MSEWEPLPGSTLHVLPSLELAQGMQGNGKFVCARKAAETTGHVFSASEGNMVGGRTTVICRKKAEDAAAQSLLAS
jgi:hypothetical protein